MANYQEVKCFKKFWYIFLKEVKKNNEANQSNFNILDILNELTYLILGNYKNMITTNVGNLIEQQNNITISGYFLSNN